MNVWHKSWAQFFKKSTPDLCICHVFYANFKLYAYKFKGLKLTKLGLIFNHVFWRIFWTVWGWFLEYCAQLLRRTPNFWTAFLSVEVECQKMKNFQRYLWLNKAKNPKKKLGVRRKSWAQFSRNQPMEKEDRGWLKQKSQ